MHAKRKEFSMFIEGWYGYQYAMPTCSQWHRSIFQGTFNSTPAESHLKSLWKSTLSNFQPFSGIGFSKQKGQEHVPIAIIAIIKLLRLGESDEYCQLILDIAPVLAPCISPMSESLEVSIRATGMQHI